MKMQASKKGIPNNVSNNCIISATNEQTWRGTEYHYYYVKFMSKSHGSNAKGRININNTVQKILLTFFGKSLIVVRGRGRL